MKVTSRTTREELVALVVQTLKDKGISAVLVGGAVVSIYTKNKYESHDLDFISAGDQEELRSALKSLGFISEGRGFTHPKSNYAVEFPPGPLAIGNEEPVKPEGKMKIGKVTVQLLSPTQSVMDRLAWFFHSNDRQCLDQAVLIAGDHNINLARVRRWSEKEGATEKFEIFLKRLKARNSSK